MCYMIDWQTAVDSMDAKVLQINGGFLTAVSGMITLNSGASAPSGTVLQSRWPVCSVGDQPLITCFTAAFDVNPAVGTVQLAGLGDGERGVWVGYNGTQFGIRLLSGGRTQVYSFAVQNAASASGSIVLTINNQQYTYAVVQGESVNSILQNVANDQNIAAANMTTCTVNNCVYIITAAAAPQVCQPGLVDNGTGCNSSLSTLVAGQSPVSEWVYPEDWNGPGLSQPSPIRWDNCNTFQVTLCTLGFGSITVSVIDPAGMNLTDLHYFTNVNSTDNFCRVALGPVPSLYSRNFTGNASVAVQSSGFLVTPRPDDILHTRIRPPFCFTNNLVNMTLGSVSTAVVTLQNVYLQAGLRNCKVISLMSISVTVQASSACVVAVQKNPILSAPLNGISQDPNSIALIDDTSNPSVVSGDLLRAWTICNNSTYTHDLTGCWAEPGSILAITAQTAQPGTQAMVSVTIVWKQS